MSNDAEKLAYGSSMIAATLTAAAYVALARKGARAIFSGGWNKMAGSVAVQPDGRTDWSPSFDGVSSEPTAAMFAHCPPGSEALTSEAAMVRALLASAISWGPTFGQSQGSVATLGTTVLAESAVSGAGHDVMQRAMRALDALLTQDAPDCTVTAQGVAGGTMPLQTNGGSDG